MESRWVNMRVFALTYCSTGREPVVFAMESEVAQHNEVSAEAFLPHATTLDYVVAAG